MVSTRSMSAAKKIESKNLQVVARSTKKTAAERKRETTKGKEVVARSTKKTAAERKRETTTEKEMEEAFKDYLKKDFFVSKYPDVNIRQEMSYPFGPLEEFKKFEDQGRAVWKSFSKPSKTFFLQRVKTLEARKETMRKMKSGQKLTDKIEKKEFNNMCGAAFVFFGGNFVSNSLPKDHWKGKAEAEILEEDDKIRRVATLKWKSMTFEEKAPYFNPKWYE